MPDEHGLPGLLALRVADVSRAVARSLSAEFGGLPSPVHPAGRVTVRGLERSRGDGPPPRRELTGDGGDGRVVGRSAEGLIVTDRHGWLRVAGPSEDFDIAIDRRRPAWSIVGDVVRPALQVAGLANGVVVVHAACVEIDGRAVLIAGWSESGKTEIALGLVEDGARFVGDKWTVLAKAHAGITTAGDHGGAAGHPAIAGPFPSRVGLRDWVLPFLPRLGDAIGRRRRVRLRAGALAARLGGAAGAIGGSHPAAAMLSRPIAQLLPLASTIRLTAAEVRAAHGQAPPSGDLALGAIVVLTTIEPGLPTGIERADPAAQARRLAVSAAYERRAFHLLGERAAAFGSPSIPGFDIVEREADALAARFGSVPVFEVRVPFPADPLVAASLIRGAL